MKKWVKRIAIVVTPLLFLVVLFSALLGIFLWSRTGVSTYESPSGDYYIKMYWTDVGGWGYRGKIYLVEDGIIDKKHWTGRTVPASCEWVSDTEFILAGKDGKPISFFVEDIIGG